MILLPPAQRLAATYSNLMDANLCAWAVAFPIQVKRQYEKTVVHQESYRSKELEISSGQGMLLTLKTPGNDYAAFC